MFSRRSGQPTEPAIPAGPQRYRSQAIGNAHERLDSEDRKVEILDLGAACGETLAFYSGLSCRLHFADSYADMKGRPRDEEETTDDILAAYAAALPFRSGTRFDLILSWDLFNYLSREEIEGLTRHLRRFSSDSAPLVSLIWNTPKIPAQPHHYAIVDAETLEYRPTTTSERPGPRYKEPDLLRAMDGYRVRRSFLLRHGVQEYVFAPRSTSDTGPGRE